MKDEDGRMWRVFAYRKLTEDEMMRQAKIYLLNTSPQKQPKPGQRVTLHTVIGMLPGL